MVGQLLVNFVPLHNNYTAAELIALQQKNQEQGITVVHLWEDVWRSREQQVLSRLQSMQGLNKRIHARKTVLIRITQPQADAFMEANHLLGTVSARYKMALMHEGEIVAVACFSGLRHMKHHPGYRSAEVIRFAAAAGITVIGGFSKLLKHFISEHRPNDVMSYADRDWSLGKVYEQVGFKLVETTPPAEIYVDLTNFKRYFKHRLPAEGNFVKIFNTGNLKYILEL